MLGCLELGRDDQWLRDNSWEALISWKGAIAHAARKVELLHLFLYVIRHVCWWQIHEQLGISDQLPDSRCKTVLAQNGSIPPFYPKECFFSRLKKSHPLEPSAGPSWSRCGFVASVELTKVCFRCESESNYQTKKRVSHTIVFLYLFNGWLGFSCYNS